MKQVLLVLSDHWNASTGVLYCLEEDLKLAPIPVSLGKNGMGWGRGEHSVQEGPEKREGDLRSPAGIFRLGPFFGKEPEILSFPYLLIDEELECVDDPTSVHYNRFVRCSETNSDWKSAEKMSLYQRGITIQHNYEAPQPGAGSCIFIHEWASEQAPTAGCTAMARERLLELFSWLDATKEPRLIQLPVDLLRN